MAADLDQARALFLKGDYTGCIQQAQQAVNDSSWDDGWPELLARAQLAVGRYPAAEKTVTDALERFPSSITLKLLAYDIFRANGRAGRADDMLKELSGVLESLSSQGRSQMRFRLNPANLVALGKALLLMNVDPKPVLENFFDKAKQLDPDCREAFLATGELALDKHDYDLAARTFNDALKKFPGDPDVQFGLARAYAPSDQMRMGKSLAAVLESNTNHVPAMLLLADHLVDTEQYDEAETILAQALEVNAWDPEAWAYRAVLAHLRNDTNAEASARSNALKYWTSNPRVDNLIGTKLSQNYRFLEGSRYQRRALEFDPDYLPAKIQLAQDLLRLGDETEGWQLAQDVHKSDGYDVTAYNLVTLHDAMAKYQTLTNHDFIVRMNSHEAEIYGDNVLALLQKAKDTLSKKYGLSLDEPTYVEIFPEQKDFGVRTFGMPHNPGFLGVCFGHVVTANSPAAQSGHPENWEDVLWHEFCHVITLNITRNKMPRWLSEGISVYEERQASPAWGQSMNPHYRQMILDGELTPVSELSSAFMSPKSPLHVQFAYYESSLVVEYIVQNFGFDSLKKILADLGDGININEAIARNTAPMEKIEKDFAAFARHLADTLAPGLDWKKPAEPDEDSEIASDFPETNNVDVIQQIIHQREGETNGLATNSVVRVNPDHGGGVVTTMPASGTSQPPARATSTPLPNYWELMHQARTAIAAKKWAEAKPPLQKLIDLYPSQTGSDSAYPLLAATDRGLNDTNQERQVLQKLASLDSDDTDTYLRLMELDESAKDWQGVSENAGRFLAVNPLLPQPYRHLARASEELGKPDPAIRSYQRLLLLDPPDPADVHYRLARLLHQKGDAAAAKRHVLQALEEAPRFHDALQLLLEIENTSATDAPSGK